MLSNDVKEGSRKALEYGAIIRLKTEDQLLELATPALTSVRVVVRVTDTIARIVRSRIELFKVVQVPDWRGHKIAIHPLGDQLLMAIKTRSVVIKKNFPMHRFHPLLELFWKHFGSYERCARLKSPATLAELNCAVANLRKDAKAPAMRATRDAYVRWVRESTKHLYSYIDRLFANHSRLLVVRVDLGYLHSVRKVGELEPISYKQARMHRKMFFYRLRQHYRVRMHGYAWSLNHAASKGYHYHVLLFFDSNQARSDYKIAEELGSLWKEVTRASGIYHNCNAEQYAERGIGMVHVADKDAMRALKLNVAAYLTKPDYYVRLEVSHGHVFDHGNMPKSTNPKRGRPRLRLAAAT